MKTGATQAIRDFGGFKQIHCYKLRKEKRTTASIHLDIELTGKRFIYDLTIKNMDKNQ